MIVNTDFALLEQLDHCRYDVQLFEIFICFADSEHLISYGLYCKQGLLHSCKFYF